MDPNAKKVNEKNLIYLTFAQNPPNFNVTRNKPNNVRLNLEKRTWSASGYTRKIGESKPAPEWGSPGEIIGVYHVLGIKQLEMMVYAVAQITRHQSSGAIDMN